jgi:septum formation protein
MSNLNQHLIDTATWISRTTKLDTLPQLVLSSSSPARRALLTRLQIPFVTVAPHVDETPLPGEAVKSMVLRLAEEKAKKPAHLYSHAHIIGCDQVGILDGTILCKPITYENAMNQLRLMSGKKVTFYTAMCLWSTQTQACQLAIETYDVHIRQLTDAMMAAYLQKEQVLQCAGSIHVEGLGISLIEKLAGDDYTALIGLPLIRLTQMLENVGIEVI